MIYEKLFENAYNAARYFRKKNLQSLLTSESLATYESLGVQYISDEEYNDDWYNLVPLPGFLLGHQQFYSLLPLHQKCNPVKVVNKI